MIRELKIFISSIFMMLFAVFSYANTPSNMIQNQHIQSKVLYVKYTDVPKVVYTKQRFNIKIKANILISQKDVSYKIHTNINQKKSNIELLSNDIIWDKIDDNNYETTLQFKVLKNSIKLPEITVSIIDKQNILIDKSKIKNQKIIYRKIAINQEKYSNIIASEFSITSIKTKQYTNKELIHVIAITAKQSNLEEFKLNNYSNQGSKVLKNIKDSQILYYFIITPRGQKSIDFNYFNTIQNKFIDISIPIKLKEQLVSTQTDLNPYENDMFIYKVLAISVVVLFFLIIYYFKREFFFLFFAVLFMTLLIYMMWPNKKVLIQKNTKVYILPTSNSTIFSILNEKKEVEILIKKENFSKILFKNGRIGWIKNG